MTKNAGMIETTVQIIEQLLGESDCESMMAAGLDLLVNALKSEAGVIWVPGEDPEWLRAACCCGPADMTDLAIGRDCGVEAAVIRDGQGRTSTGSEDRTEETAFDRAGYTADTLVCVPLKTPDAVLGCLIVANRKNGEAYTPEEQKLCGRIAALLAMAMTENGYTYREPEKKELLLRARDIIKEYPSGGDMLRVLKGINLDIYKGELVVLLGESGCGKSTLVNIIAGMDNMTAGTLTVEGKDFSHPSDEELTAFRRNDVGFVFQSYNLMPNLTAVENIRFLAELVANPMNPMDALKEVGLEDRADHYPSMLSGGQQQRVSIARAIVKRPKVIFADEPTAALDYQTSIEVLTVFEDIVRTQGTTVVMITHNPEIARMANRVVRIRDGRIASIRINRIPAGAQELSW